MDSSLNTEPTLPVKLPGRRMWLIVRSRSGDSVRALADCDRMASSGLRRGVRGVRDRDEPPKERDPTDRGLDARLPAISGLPGLTSADADRARTCDRGVVDRSLGGFLRFTPVLRWR